MEFYVSLGENEALGPNSDVLAFSENGNMMWRGGYPGMHRQANELYSSIVSLFGLPYYCRCMSSIFKQRHLLKLP